MTSIFDELIDDNLNFFDLSSDSTWYYEDGLPEDLCVDPILDNLIKINEKGFLTAEVQPKMKETTIKVYDDGYETVVKTEYSSIVNLFVEKKSEGDILDIIKTRCKYIIHAEHGIVETNITDDVWVVSSCSGENGEWEPLEIYEPEHEFPLEELEDSCFYMTLISHDEELTKVLAKYLSDK